MTEQPIPPSPSRGDGLPPCGRQPQISAVPAIAPAADFPAFKEWAAVVAALGAGAQTIILRKGGISEGRGGFDPDHAPRFWLFPTAFHAQREKLRPEAARFFPATDPEPGVSPAVPPALDTYADLVAHRFVSEWSEVSALAPHHFWTEPTVRERFDWSRPAGLHVLLVRVHRLATPLVLPSGLNLGGCKSWIDLPLGDPAAHASSPALDDLAFAAARERFQTGV
ncbi:MAG: DUF1802 family protein [Burkholderiales bacterium]|nr:DUF1802 family protein [Opitutaceae bacterium]